MGVEIIFPTVPMGEGRGLSPCNAPAFNPGGSALSNPQTPLKWGLKRIPGDKNLTIPPSALILYNELCHILQLEFLFDNGILFYYDNKLKGDPDRIDVVNSMYKENGGHTTLWYTYVNKINKALLINPPLDKELTNKDLSDIFLESIFKKEGIDLDMDGFEDDFGYAKYLSNQKIINN